MIRAGPAAAPRGGRSDGRLAIGFIGAGNYASATLLPRLVGLPNAYLAHVATTRSLSAVNAQRRFGFTTASTSADAVLEDEHPGRDLHRDPASHARGPGLPCPADRARRSSWRSPSR